MSSLAKSLRMKEPFLPPPLMRRTRFSVGKNTHMSSSWSTASYVQERYWVSPHVRRLDEPDEGALVVAVLLVPHGELPHELLTAAFDQHRGDALPVHRRVGVAHALGDLAARQLPGVVGLRRGGQEDTRGHQDTRNEHRKSRDHLRVS